MHPPYSVEEFVTLWHMQNASGEPFLREPPTSALTIQIQTGHFQNMHGSSTKYGPHQLYVLNALHCASLFSHGWSRLDSPPSLDQPWIELHGRVQLLILHILLAIIQFNCFQIVDLSPYHSTTIQGYLHILHHSNRLIPPSELHSTWVGGVDQNTGI